MALALMGAPARADRLEPWQAAAAPLSLQTLDGGRVDLADLADRVVLVHFFATWCEPCRDELAALDRLAGHFNGHPVQVLAIDSGEPEGRIRRFFETLPVRFPVLLDPDRTATKAWDVATLPSTFIVGADRRTLYKVEGDFDWMAAPTLDTIAGAAASARRERAPNR